MKTHTPGFTLIELLVVVLLLTVLMLTAFPAYRGLQRATNRHRAVAEADAIAQAAIAYRRTYGQWPLEDKAENLALDSTAIVAGRGLNNQNLEISQVVAVLRNANLEDNPRRMLFLELPDDRFDDGTPLDPWHQPYVLVMTRVGMSESDKTFIARTEGGVRSNTLVTRSNPYAATAIDGPEDALAFSWGDPASPETNRIIRSWSKR